MTTLTENLGQHRPDARTERMRRPVDPTDTIMSIASLPPVPAPRPRHPGGAVTTMPTTSPDSTRPGEGFLWALICITSFGVGMVLPRAFVETVAVLQGWF